MTDANRSALKPEVQPWFEAWKASAGSVLSQISGQPQVFEVVDAPFTAADSDLRYTVAAAGAFQGELALRLSEASGIRLARMFLRGAPEAPGSTSEAAGAITNEEREALDEFLRQVGGQAASALVPHCGGEIRFQLSSIEAPWSGTADAVALLRTSGQSGSGIDLEVRISPAMAAALATRALDSSAAPTPGNPPVPTEAAANAAGSNSAVGACGAHSEGYRRLLDVGLGVKLRFGTRRMLLRDVLAFSSGLVVELDNPLDSPVDLLLDGRVVARGEVVVVDGKYGLRVTQVSDPPAETLPV